LPKTIRFNFTYLPLADALRLPVLVCHRVHFERLGGKVRVAPHSRRGTVHIGFGEVGIFDRERRRSIWQVDGEVVFQGRAELGHGTKVSVGPGGVLTFGDGFEITAETAIVCRKEITFGKDVLISWDVQVMDTDLHSIVDADGAVLNPDGRIVIDDHVWIGSRVLVLKGVHVARDSVVAAGSILTRGTYAANAIVAGSPAREIRHGISWSSEPAGDVASDEEADGKQSRRGAPDLAG
jgi:acetyltransferase-like isoleucine patch superfamily enzyme